MLYLLFFIGIYFLIGGLLFLHYFHLFCKLEKIKFKDINEISFSITTSNGITYDGILVMLIFIIQWPKLLNLTFKKYDEDGEWL